MADTLNLVCKQHREYLWIGQLRYGQPETAYLYDGPEAVEKLQRFTKHHALCEPVIMNDETMMAAADDMGVEFVDFAPEET